jgi:plasmid stabilization system protein ParE
LIGYTPRAARQVAELRQFYEDKERPEAIAALNAALEAAEQRIAEHPAADLPAPRPYPQLATQGRAWIKSGRYWIAYRTKSPLLIVAVIFETANIPRRL